MKKTPFGVFLPQFELSSYEASCSFRFGLFSLRGFGGFSGDLFGRRAFFCTRLSLEDILERNALLSQGGQDLLF